MNNRETRSIATDYASEANTLTGLAAVYDSPTRITEGGRTFTEVVRHGAFDRMLRTNPDILVCFNHDVSRLLGRTSSGTAKVWSDNVGLRFSVELPQSADDVRELALRGDLSGCSFAFSVIKDRWTGDVRELLELQVYELGPVVLPAYSASRITGLRSLSIPRLRLMLLERA